MVLRRIGRLGGLRVAVLIVSAAVAGVLAGSGGASTATAASASSGAAPVLAYGAPDHTDPDVLDDGEVVPAGSVLYVVAPTAGSVAEVDFSLGGQPWRTEHAAPFDFGGTAPDGTGTVVRLSPGRYSLRADVVLASGEHVQLTRVFEQGRAATRQAYLAAGSRRHQQTVALDDGSSIPPSVFVYVAEYDADDPAVRPTATSVDFYVDGRFVRTEGLRPFDLGGTAADGSAQPDGLPVGRHAVTAVVKDDAGGFRVLRATVSRFE